MFPFKKDYLIQDKYDVYKNLLNFNPEQLVKKYDDIPYNMNSVVTDFDTRFDGQYWVLEHSYPYHYMKYNVLSDFYIEDIRVKTIVKPFKQSPYDFFIQNVDLVKNGRKPIQQRDFIYRKIREAAQFKPTLAKFIYQYFNATKILDPCAGWGDRLLAATTLDVEYWGFDPNSELHPRYSNMINDFASDPKLYRLCKLPFEESRKILKSEYGTFDVCLCSPPYFDYEQYSPESTQSIVAYKTQKSWLANFMYPLIDIVYDCLKKDGIFALHLSDNKRFKLTKPIIKYAMEVFQYSGCIFSTEMATNTDPSMVYPKPIWIFTK